MQFLHVFVEVKNTNEQSISNDKEHTKFHLKNFFISHTLIFTSIIQYFLPYALLNEHDKFFKTESKVVFPHFKRRILTKKIMII